MTSIVIVHWNTPRHLARCVQAVRRHTAMPYELILIDNGSHEAARRTVESLVSTAPRVRAFFLPENVGYAAGNNRGIAEARGETICLLNSDAFVSRGWLESLLRCLEERGAGMAGPCTNRCKGPQRRKPWLRLFPPPAWSRPTREVDFLSFFCVLIRRDVLDRVGVLDERFGIGCFEDVDFCRRARQAGFTLWIDGRSWVWHEAHATFLANDLREEEERARNRVVFDRKWQDSKAADSGSRAGRSLPPVTPGER